MTAPRRASAVVLGLGLLLVPAPGSGQEGAVVDVARVERAGASDVAVDRRLERMLREETPLVLAGDTVLTAADSVRGSVLVLDATLVLEGVIEGDLVLVDAGAFVRPGAIVTGDLVNVAGGLYRSDLARVRGAIIDLPTAEYRVVREVDRLVIEATGTPARLTLDGVMGVRVPTYDRVNGLTAIWGARYRLPRLGPVTPSVHGQAGWRTELGEPTWEASAELRWLATALEAGAGKGWSTNDDWVRGDLANSFNYVWDGDDFRDYNEVERVWVRALRELGDEEKSFYAVLEVAGQVEDAASLEGGEPWHLFGDSTRSNPEIDDGRTTSVLTRFTLEWNGRETWFRGGVEYEAAREWLEGEFEFDRAAVRIDWAMRALANHTLEIDAFVQQPLGGDGLPRQEWSYVGGSGTLQTVEFARYVGDRVVFVETTYTIPLPERVALPVLGAPEIELIHAAGMAWTAGEDRPPLAQEIGAQLLFFGLDFRYMLDPDDPSRGDLDIGVNLPLGGGYPWEKR